MHIKIQEYVFYRRLLNCHQELIMPKTSRRLQQQRKSAKCHAEKYYNKSEYQLLSVTIILIILYIIWICYTYIIKKFKEWTFLVQVLRFGRRCVSICWPMQVEIKPESGKYHWQKRKKYTRMSESSTNSKVTAVICNQCSNS